MGLKTAGYWLTGSVGLLSDAIESLVNLFGGIMALAMLTIAARPADAYALNPGHSRVMLIPIGIHLDLTGQLPAHDAPTHPDGEEQTERYKPQVRKGRHSARLEDATFGDEQPDESAEYPPDQDRAAESERPHRRLDHH